MDEVRWLSADEQRSWRAYLEATRMLLARLDQQLQRDADISFTDFELLVTLSEAEGGQMRMSSLAEATMATRSGVTRAISRLVDLGWAERRPCPSDRRGQVAVLTDAGRAKLRATSPGHVAAVRRLLFDSLSPRDVERVGQVFGEVRDHIADDPGDRVAP